MPDTNDDLSDFPIPPASFGFLVESVLMQAQMQLGLLHLDPNDKDREPNLPMARHSIDMLAMLQEKTKGNLTIEEKRLIENGLTELRFRFVQVADESKKLKENSPAAAEASTESRIIRDDSPRIIADDGPRIITPDGGKGTKTL